MSWFFSLGISMSWLFVLWKNTLETRCRDLIVSVSRCSGVLVLDFGVAVFSQKKPWFFCFEILMCLHGLVFVFIVKPKRIMQYYFYYIVEQYFNYPNLCSSYLHNVCISELATTKRPHVKVPRRKFVQYFTDSYHTKSVLWRKTTRRKISKESFINSFHFL